AANLAAGIYAQTELLPQERAADLDDLRGEYYARHPPSTPEMRSLVDRLITCEWLLRRLHIADHQLYLDIDAASQSCHKLSRLQRRVNATRRIFFVTLHQLELLEAALTP